MRKFYQNSPYLNELETELFASLQTSFAAPLPGPLFMGDDFAGDASTLGVVDVTGLATSGVIETEGDSDWFAVALMAGQNFEISYPDFESEGVFFEIYDAAGVEISETRSFTSYSDDYFGFTANADATYYVAVTGFAPFTGINYSFYGAVYDDDFSADITTTALLISGETFSGVLEAVTDVDWIGVDLTAGELFNVIVSSGNMDPDIKLYTATGELASGYSTELTSDLTGTIVSFTPTQSERYYISVQNGFDGFPSNQYSLSSFTDDFSADTSTTGEVAIDGHMITIIGEHETETDVDWFEITLSEDQTIEINNGYDFGISFYDSNGDFVSPSGTGFDFNGFPVTVLTADIAGTYYVAVQNDIFIPQTYALSGVTYTDDYQGDISTTASLEIDGSISGALQGLSDTDWFSMSLTENERLTISSDLPGDGSTYLSLRDASGGIIGSAYGSGQGNLSLIFDVVTTGTYFLEVAYDFAMTSITPYTLSATTETITPDIADDITTTATISVGETVSSDIEHNTDDDWFAFSIADGEAIKFDLTTNDGSNLPLSFYNSTGNTVVYNYYGGEYLFDVSLLGLSGGDYFVGVSSYYDGTPYYDLTATAAEADIAGNITTTATIAIGETVSSVINSNNDSDWFAFSATDGQVIDFDWTVDNNRALDWAVYNDQGIYIYQLSFSDGVFVAPEAGDYFVGVSAYYDGMPGYSLTANELFDDYAGNATTTGLIAGGEELTVNFEYATDVDWIKLNGEVGEVLRLSPDNTNNYDFYVVDSDNNIVEGYYFSNDGSQIFIDFTIPDDSDYFLRLTSDEYFWTQGQTLTVSAETVIDDFLGTAETTDILSAGATQIIRHDFQNDQDWFILDTSAGGDILLTVTPPEFDPFNYQEFYGVVNIHDAVGNILQTFYAGNFNENAFSVSLDASATYYVSTTVPGNDFDIEYSLSSSILTLNGTDGQDTLIGTEIDDTIFGGGDADIIFGLGGDDVLMGGSSEDALSGGSGSDVLNGGQGRDTAIYTAELSGAIVDLSTGLGGADSSAEGDSYISIEDVVGSAFDDNLTGNSGSNNLSGSDGNDMLFGLEGDDALFGGDGDDTLEGGAGFDDLYGDAGADILTGGADSDTFHYQTLRGNLDGDIITDFSDYDRLDFSGVLLVDGLLLININFGDFTGTRGEMRFEISGDDTLLQIDTNGDGTANETLTFLNYTDGFQFGHEMQLFGIPVITGDADSNYLTGGELAERFYGLSGSDTIFSYGGDDFIDGGYGNDSLYGGSGNDSIVGGHGRDTIYGENGDDILDAGSGDDYVYGGSGADDLNGGDGFNYLFGQAGDDVLRGEAGTNYLTDVEGTNTFLLTGGVNFIEGNSQSVIDFSAASSGAVADLMMVVANSDAAAGDSYMGVDNITGSDFADRLFGDNDANMLIGGEGNDALFGRNGDDIFIGGNGADVFSGGGGFDTVNYNDELSAVTVDMMGLVIASRAALGDKLYSIESVIGTDFNDRIFGNNDGNLIEGGAGNDSLFGRNGNDIINGGEGNDLISAGAHDDVINGGQGNDRLYTGTGNDIVIIETASSGNDSVYDFILGLDTILIDDETGSFDSFAELMAAGTDDGTNVTFDFGGGNSLTLNGYNLADLSETDFDFGDVPPSAELIDTELYASDAFAALETFDWGAA